MQVQLVVVRTKNDRLPFRHPRRFPVSDDSPTPQSQYRSLAPESFAAIVLVVFCVPALAYSGFLTFVKFQALWSCDSVVVAACGSGCSRAMFDTWSMVGGVPVTVYASAYYLILLVIAGAIGLGPRAFTPIARFPALVLGTAGLIVSVAFAWRARVGLGEFCELCSVLYLANLGIFLAVWALHREGYWRGLFGGLRRLHAIVWLMSAVLALGFAAGVLVQRRVWLQQERAVLKETVVGQCPTPLLPPPPASTLMLASDGPPEVLVTAFIDLACHYCRDKVKQLRALHDKYRAWLQIEFVVVVSDPDYGRPRVEDLIRAGSAIAARTLMCWQRLAPEADAAHLDRLFALQDQPSPFFTPAGMAELTTELGLTTTDHKVCTADPTIVDQLGVAGHYMTMAALDVPSLVVTRVPPGEARPIGSDIKRRITGVKDPQMIEQILVDVREDEEDRR